MKLHFASSLVALLALAACGGQAQSQTEQQTLVDRSTLAVQEMTAENTGTEARNLLKLHQHQLG